MPPAAAPRTRARRAGAAAAAWKVPAKRKTPAKKDPKKRSVTPENGTGSDDEESEDGKGGKTTDEVRRQRRASNRESARRSRRRKPSTPRCWTSRSAGTRRRTRRQERLREMEQRVESVIRENAGLKAEVKGHRRCAGRRRAGRAGAVVEPAEDRQRRTLAAGPKATLGDGTASPAIGEDSPRGFVPFRSLQSYENLLSLQAQTR